jgi:hypothetical protein
MTKGMTTISPTLPRIRSGTPANLIQKVEENRESGGYRLDRVSRRRADETTTGCDTLRFNLPFDASRFNYNFGLITSQIAKATAPSDYVLLDWQAAGPRVPTAFRTHNVTLPKSSVISTIGSLSAADREVASRVKSAMGIK